jgi:broad-specificity NMP kinase
MNNQDLNATITINVCGTPGVGKSTIAYLVADFLSHTGFDVAVNLADGVDEDMVMDKFEEKLDSIQERGTSIVVNEVSVRP